MQLRLSLPGRDREISVVDEFICIVKEGEGTRGPGKGLQLIEFDEDGKKEMEKYIKGLKKNIY